MSQLYKYRYSIAIKRLVVIPLLFFTALAAATAPLATEVAATPKYSWLQIGATGILARALISGPQCPTLLLDDKPVPMQVRVAASSVFPLTSCQSPIPTNVRTISIAGQALPVPNLNPQRTVIMGDTGCRINHGNVQDCNNVEHWPFAQLAAQAAKAKPDLVIHVGDYYYRRVACPVGDKECAGNPHGDNWPAWEADFFQPATPLLKAAPWVMLRGNHEICQDGGHGWFRLLDTHAYTPDCQDRSDPYAVTLQAFNLLVVDNSDIDLAKTSIENQTTFQHYLDPLKQLNKNPTWLMMHRPAWVVKHNPRSQNGMDKVADPTWMKELPANVQLVLSGHYHTFEALTFNTDRAAQLIVGTGGTRLEEEPVEGDLTGVAVAGQIITQGLAVHKFGYLLMEKNATGWDGRLYSPHGQRLAVCTLQQKQLSCH